ncbi:hypothetical protein HDV06_004513 [Boothiomyces sp. JEL0866]|nr:hypothetical protein HDV06_004513 [Boothiomyces sp. JEL0866]
MKKLIQEINENGIPIESLIQDINENRLPIQSLIDDSEREERKRKRDEVPSMLYVNKPKTFKPESDVLSRVQSFLPQLEESNKELQDKINNNVDVNLENVDGRYIQMDLECGVFDMKKGEYQYDSTLVEEAEEKSEKLLLGNERTVEIKEISEDEEEDYESESEDNDDGSEYEPENSDDDSYSE